MKMCICKIWFSIFFFFFFLFFNLFMYMLMYDYSMLFEWNVLSLYSININMVVLFDWMSFLFLSFVLLISSMVILYSKGYMANDYNINRFIMLVLMFVFSMMLLILSPNLISILLGWDGLGLVSYCLVIYYQNMKSYNAGMMTVLSNRVGDVFLLMCIAWMINYGSWNFMFYLDNMLDDLYLSIIGLLVIMASITKSAQIPFSSWLPMAMAAPTPVSALVHSSTLVTSGVYLLIRFNLIFDNYYLMNILLFLSSLTMFISGLGANFEFDIKKIIALSTLSQLGLMMMILSLNYYYLAFFHLLIHALFKALLFMCAGMIIHNMNDMQDIRFMGGISFYMPMSTMCFFVANLCLCGMPFLSGFYSKDLILEVFYISYINMFSLLLCILSTGMTVCYSFRLIYYLVLGNNNYYVIVIVKEDLNMLMSMFLLLFMSIISGSLMMWLMFSSYIVIILPIYIKMMTLLVCFLGGLLGILISNVSMYYFNVSYFMYNFSDMSSNMMYMPMISSYGMVKIPLEMGMSTYKLFDLGWFEYLGG
uniref:NADH dehydrogenase subunit 5 n=1 Tax=Brachytarsina amboinensis TaxID=3018683 RepID=UPI0023AAB929|nr:NADH dehydrogenase subunit 5 [Brachytarsina amboinensis]WCL18791.1 NADH dehydrogenase subunit 5 [Brachytarsina amboinensis]